MKRSGHVPGNLAADHQQQPIDQTCAPLAATNLVRVFDGGVGVRGISLDVRRGEVHALVGLNGAGKTTLMRLLLGMLRPDSGSVHLHGVNMSDAGPETWSRVGHLIEQPSVYPELSTRDNLVIAARLYGVQPTSIPEMVDRALAELALERYERVRAARLSQGNRQRVGLARAFQHGPNVIILDEPTNGLDPAGVRLLRSAILSRASDGAAVLVSSHHLDEVARIATRITVVNDGKVIGTLDPAGIDLERTFFDMVHADDEERLAG